MTDFSQLPEWTCHKVVRAAKIVDHDTSGEEHFLTVQWSDGDQEVKTQRCHVDAAIFARARPALGDYLVVYEDGYVSWSPAKVFEDGYTLGARDMKIQEFVLRMKLAEVMLAQRTVFRRVIDWLNDEGQAGRLRTAGEAPHWTAYLEAQKAVTAALDAIPVETKP